MHRRNSIQWCFDCIPLYLRFPFRPRLDWLVDANVSGVNCLSNGCKFCFALCHLERGPKKSPARVRPEATITEKSGYLLQLCGRMLSLSPLVLSVRRRWMTIASICVQSTRVNGSKKWRKGFTGKDKKRTREKSLQPPCHTSSDSFTSIALVKQSMTTTDEINSNARARHGGGEASVTLVNRAIFSSPFCVIRRSSRPPFPRGRFFATRSGHITQPGQRVNGTVRARAEK